MRRVIFFVTVTCLTPMPALADTANAVSGAKTEVARHSRFDNNCQSARVQITVRKTPANGTLIYEPVEYAVPAVDRRGEKQPAQCVGKMVKGVAVSYQSKPGFRGTDRFRYSRVNADKSDDRFNTEMNFTVRVK